MPGLAGLLVAAATISLALLIWLYPDRAGNLQAAGFDDSAPASRADRRSRSAARVIEPMYETAAAAASGNLKLGGARSTPTVHRLPGPTTAPALPASESPTPTMRYPVGIAIPVPISVASRPAAPVRPADPLPVRIPIRLTSLFDSSSVRASSISLSPHPSVEKAHPPSHQSWAGSTSVATRDAAVQLRPGDELVRRRRQIAAGASLAVVLAVAVRR